MEYYSTTKASEIVPFIEMWLDLESIIEWSKSEIEKHLLYISTYMWNLEKCYRWTYLQGMNRDTDIESKQMDTKVKRGCGM